jgi:hypothetical protein
MVKKCNELTLRLPAALAVSRCWWGRFASDVGGVGGCALLVALGVSRCKQGHFSSGVGGIGRCTLPPALVVSWRWRRCGVGGITALAGALCQRCWVDVAAAAVTVLARPWQQWRC